jgi:hypothetical protein
MQDIDLHAIRNGGELAYAGHPFSDAIWEGPDGELVSVAFEGESVEAPFGAMRGGRVDADIPWIAFVHRKSGLGLAVIFMEYTRTNPRALDGRAPTHNEGIYLFGSKDGDAWFRAPIWEYALFDRERSPAIHVPAGSTYRERNAFLPFRFEHDDLRMVRDWSTRLRRPLEPVYESRDDRQLSDQPDPGDPPERYEPGRWAGA